MAEGNTARHVALAELVTARQFTVPYAVNLTLTITGGLFTLNNVYKVKDSNGDVVFMVKGISFSTRLLLVDAAGTPLLTMKPKALSRHEAWRVFKGESTSPNDQLFEVRSSKMFQWKDNFDVFFANNNTDDEASPCDFKILSRTTKCTISKGETDQIVAQMHRNTTLLSREKLEITVNPNEDFAFVTSLIVILEQIQAGRVS